MYTIKQVASLTGVAEATLRAWERRYGVVVPQRSPSGYRVYDAGAVRALTLMQSLVQQGWAPRLAAVEARRQVGAWGEERAEAAGAGGTDTDTAALVRAATALDPLAVADLLDRRFALGSFEAVVDGWLMPALAELGLAWADGRVTVAGEHMVSAAVQRRLAAVHDASAARLAGPRLLVGLPPGGRHELGLLAFATAARRVGVATTYLGADLPVADWLSAVEVHDAAAVATAANHETDVAPTEDLVTALRGARPGLLVGVGGARQADVGADCLPLGHLIGDAARAVAARLREAQRP